jgi:hypothetical protein
MTEPPPNAGVSLIRGILAITAMSSPNGTGPTSPLRFELPAS